MFALIQRLVRLVPYPVKQYFYRLGPISSWIRSMLNRMLPSGLSEVEVLDGELKGLRLLLNLQHQKDFWLGTYEPQTQRALRDWIRQGMTIYDLGANIGYLSILSARLAGSEGQVFAFEPQPANLEQLQANLDLNQQGAPIELIQRAVYDRTGDIEFLLHPSGSMGRVQASPGRKETYSASIQVAAVSLDDFVHKEGHPAPDLVKMDVEGTEGLVLGGMPRLLREARPVLMIELHGPEAARQVESILTHMRYSLHLQEAHYPPVEKLHTLPKFAHILARPAP